jgi:hypothetical protein
MQSVTPGQRFGRGIVTVAEARNRENRRSAWLACDCGTTYLATISSLYRRRGGTKSCGCLKGKPPPVRAGQKFGTSVVVGRVRAGTHRAAVLRCGACGRERTVQLGRVAERGICRCQRLSVRAGQRYGRGVVQAVVQGDAVLRCDCGRSYRTRSDHLTGGGTRSCGCLRRGGGHVTHGLSSHPMYDTWHGVMRRHPGLGQWRDPAVFISDVGTRRAGHILRIEGREARWVPWGHSTIDLGDTE